MLVLIFVTIAVEGHSQGSPAYGEAQKAYALKHFKEAAQLFRKAAADERGLPPKAPTDALFMQARCLANLGEFVAAETVAQAYLNEDKNSCHVLYLLGYILERENKPKDSLEVFTRAAAISAPRPEDLRIVALDYILLDDYTDAIHWFNRAVEQDASNVEAWYDLGRAQMHSGTSLKQNGILGACL